MKWLRKNGLVAFLGLAAMAGVITAGHGIYRAMTAADVVLAVGTTGSLVDGQIQEALSSSRNLVFESLRDTANLQEFWARSRVNDELIRDSLARLQKLNLPDPARSSIAQFFRSWEALREGQQEVLRLVRFGSIPDATVLARGKAANAFEKSGQDLLALRQSLTDVASDQDQTLRRALYQVIAEMVMLSLATVLFVVTLMWSYRRAREYVYVRQHNEELARAERLERERARVLEMAGKNEPLVQVLGMLVSLIEQHIPNAAACVTVFEQDEMHQVVAPSLPHAFIEEIHKPRIVKAWLTIEPGGQDLVPSIVGSELQSAWSHVVSSSAGQRIGVVDLYWRVPGKLNQAELVALESSANLAGIVIQHRQLYEQMSFQAQRDPLTELPNRRLFQDRLEQSLLRASRVQEQVGVLLIDLDRFKQVNDLLGHRVGDALLKEVARRVAACLRKSDTLARIGGDEFTVILNSISDVPSAETAARKILQALARPLTLFGHELTISASIGLSVFPEHGREPATLVRNADLAMYHAKGQGKNGFETYVPALGDSMLQRMNIEKCLERAIENDELEVHYQLQTDFDRRIVGCEALIRWKSATLGRVSPEVFLPVAEESGLIVPIGTWVMYQACLQNAAWRQAGYPAAKISVNISPRQLAQADFVEQVREVLQSTGLPPQYLELELTETALMQKVDDCLERLVVLRSLGVGVTIDDFGSGYSSLGYLQRLPVQSVKIDQSFVSGSEASAQSTLPLIGAIVDLAHGLGLTVIAEGVETEQQLNALREAGCDAAQGYFLHRPGPAAEIGEVLRGQHDGLLQLNEALNHSFSVLNRHA